MSFEVRELRPEDAARCAELEQVLFPGDNPWPERVFLVEFSHPHTFYVGVFDSPENTENPEDPEATDARLVGYGGIAILGPPNDPEFEVHTIGVDPAYQRRGIGRHIMDQLTHAADLMDGQMFLEVRTDNDPAITMYESFGFETLATRKNYYQPSGGDAYTMTRKSRSER